jgi:hypothetical protein
MMVRVVRRPPMWAPRDMDPRGSKYAVKPCARGTHAVERSCQSPIGEHESAFLGIAQLIIVPISDIMSTRTAYSNR